MFEIGWSEMLVIAVVMIVVVGPKDLPRMLRTMGKMTAKMTSMAGDFRKQFEEAMKEADLEDVKSSIDDLRSLDPRAEIRKALNPMEKAAADVKAGLDQMGKPKPAVTPEGAAKSDGTVETSTAPSSTVANPVAANPAPMDSPLDLGSISEPATPLPVDLVAKQPGEPLGSLDAAAGHSVPPSTPIAAAAAAASAAPSTAEPAPAKPARSRKKADIASGDGAESAPKKATAAKKAAVAPKDGAKKSRTVANVDGEATKPSRRKSTKESGTSS